MAAAATNRLTATEVLLNATSDIDFADITGRTALWYASYFGHKAPVESLLREGAGVNFKDNLGFSPLYAASIEGILDVAKTLIRAGADVNAAEYEQDFTPLHIAARNGHALVVKALLEKGADPMITDIEGRTPLDVVNGLGTELANPEVIKMLENRVQET